MSSRRGAGIADASTRLRRCVGPMAGPGNRGFGPARAAENGVPQEGCKDEGAFSRRKFFELIIELGNAGKTVPYLPLQAKGCQGHFFTVGEWGRPSLTWTQNRCALNRTPRRYIKPKPQTRLQICRNRDEAASAGPFLGPSLVGPVRPGGSRILRRLEHPQLSQMLQPTT